jgi:hypothetical protein
MNSIPRVAIILNFLIILCGFAVLWWLLDEQSVVEEYGVRRENREGGCTIMKGVKEKGRRWSSRVRG